MNDKFITFPSATVLTSVAVRWMYRKLYVTKEDLPIPELEQLIMECRFCEHCNNCGNSFTH